MEKQTKAVNIEDKIANRNNWLKIFVIVLIICIVTYKIAELDLNRALSGFDFSDLLSLLLAIFSIGLSVLFYLKATDTSNVFYDNTYRFTRDVSEILGRVEAGFGERLKHLDEGYSGLKTAFERIPLDLKSVESKIGVEEEEVSQTLKERKELLEALAEKAQLADAEKENLFETIAEQDRRLSEAYREIEELQRIINADQKDFNSMWIAKRVEDMPAIMSTYIIPYLSYTSNKNGTLRFHEKDIYINLNNIPNHIRKYLIEMDVVTKTGLITELGFEIAERLIFNNAHKPRKDLG